MLLGDQLRPAQIIQGPLDGGARQPQLGRDGPYPWPTLALAVCAIPEIHIHCSGSMADVKLFREHKQITGACLWPLGQGQALFLYPLEILRSGLSKPAIRE